MAKKKHSHRARAGKARPATLAAAAPAIPAFVAATAAEPAAMGYAEVKQNIYSNAVSNYLRTFAGMAVGLVSFRVLFQAFSKEEFGFWSLLWSVFGYGILMDFGFGFAAQKRVAELSVTRQWDKLSGVLSTILFFYLGIAALLAVFVGLFSHQIVAWFGVSGSNTESFRLAMIVFFVAIGLAFPMGIFPEILRGQQRIRLANNLTTGTMIVRLGFILWAVWQHWSFLSIMLVALFFALLPDVLAAFLALRQMPQVRLRVSLFSRAVMRETMSFSLFAYISTATNIVLGKTDQLVLSGTLGVMAVAVYQAGAKVSEIFAQFTKQLQDTLSPAAAHLHATGDRNALGDLLVMGTRWSVLIATPLYLLSAFYLRELLQVLTGDTVIPQETWLTGQVLIFWFYTTTITHSVSKRIFMMTGHERRLMWMGLGEAGANLVLSVVLVLTFRNVLCVALGSLVPTLIFGWCLLWPWMARESGHSFFSLLRRTVFPVWGACLPVLAVLALATFHRFNAPLATLLTHGPVIGALALISLWHIALKPNERAAIVRRLPGRALRLRTDLLPAL